MEAKLPKEDINLYHVLLENLTILFWDIIQRSCNPLDLWEGHKWTDECALSVPSLIFKFSCIVHVEIFNFLKTIVQIFIHYATFLELFIHLVTFQMLGNISWWMVFFTKNPNGWKVKELKCKNGNKIRKDVTKC